MGKILFSIVSACLLFTATHSLCQTTHKGIYGLTTASIIPGPEFISELFMDAHVKGVITNASGLNKITYNIQALITAKALENKTGFVADSNATGTAQPAVNTQGEKIEPATDIAATPPPTATADITVPAEEEVDTVIGKYAEMISVDPIDITNYSLYRFIDDWYGTKYKWGGMDKTGVDCSAFSQKLYSDVYGVDLMRTARQQRRHSERVSDYDEANEGDLIFFRIRNIRVSHVGIYLANGYFVHASRRQGVVISSLDDRYWRRHYAGCGRMQKSEHSMIESDFMQ